MKTIIATATMVCSFACQEAHIQPPKIEVKQLDPKIEIVQKIAHAFPESPRTMLAIALEESTLNPKATGYNCRYKISSSTGTLDSLTGRYIDLSALSKEARAGYVSTWCRKQHRSMAWSTDGGLFGIHNPTRADYDVDTNIQKARAKFDTQGLRAWTAYKSGRYKDNLKEADRLLSMLTK